MTKWLTIVCCLWMGLSTTQVFANNQVADIIQQLEVKSKDIQSVGNEISTKNSLEQNGTLTEQEQVTQAKVIYDSSQQVAKLSAERQFIEPDNKDTGMKLVYFNETSDTYYWKDTENWHVSLLEKQITALYPDYFVHLKIVTNILEKAEADGVEIKIEEIDDIYQLTLEDTRLDLINAMKDAYEISITGVEPSTLTQRLQILVNKKEGRLEKVTLEIEGSHEQTKVKIQSASTYNNWNNIKDEEIVHPDNE